MYLPRLHVHQGSMRIMTTEAITDVRRDRDDAIAILKQIRERGPWKFIEPHQSRRCFYCDSGFPEHQSLCIWHDLEDWLFYYNS